jgi:hypothetical protein
MELFRFSPIGDEQTLREAILYIAETTKKLSEKIIGESFPISSLTIFSHYDDEFEKLKTILLSWGNQFTENNGPFVKLTNPISLFDTDVEKIRIRKPDVQRPQVGCNDFLMSDYQTFKKDVLPAHPNNLRLIVHPDYEMIEFYDSIFDVLAYIVNKQF